MSPAVTALLATTGTVASTATSRRRCRQRARRVLRRSRSQWNRRGERNHDKGRHSSRVDCKPSTCRRRHRPLPRIAPERGCRSRPLGSCDTGTAASAPRGDRERRLHCLRRRSLGAAASIRIRSSPQPSLLMRLCPLRRTCSGVRRKGSSTSLPAGRRGSTLCWAEQLVGRLLCRTRWSSCGCRRARKEGRVAE